MLVGDGLENPAIGCFACDLHAQQKRLRSVHAATLGLRACVLKNRQLKTSYACVSGWCKSCGDEGMDTRDCLHGTRAAACWQCGCCCDSPLGSLVG